MGALPSLRGALVGQFARLVRAGRADEPARPKRVSRRRKRTKIRLLESAAGAHPSGVQTFMTLSRSSRMLTSTVCRRSHLLSMVPVTPSPRRAGTPSGLNGHPVGAYSARRRASVMVRPRHGTKDATGLTRFAGLDYFLRRAFELRLSPPRAVTGTRSRASKACPAPLGELTR
jgi:hypothetical protein